MIRLSFRMSIVMLLILCARSSYHLILDILLAGLCKCYYYYYYYNLSNIVCQKLQSIGKRKEKKIINIENYIKYNFHVNITF